MNFTFIKLILIISALLLAIAAQAQSWTAELPFPGAARDDGASFTIGNKAYCGSGVNLSAILGDFYVYDLNLKTWSGIQSLPQFKERQYASAFATDSFGFLFGGLSNDFLNDLWKYDPILNTWTEKSSLPNTPRGGAASFVIDHIAYIIGGKTDSLAALNEVWAYDMINDSWQQKNNLPFGSRWRSAAAANDSLGFLAFGLDENLQFHSDVYQYNPINDSWLKLADHPSGGRNYVKMQLLHNQLIMVGGMDSNSTFLKETWSYDLTTTIWKAQAEIPGQAIRGGICFKSENAVFYTTGLNEDRSRSLQTWRFEKPTSLPENKTDFNFNLYPNPTKNSLQIIIDQPNDFSYEYSILDYLGTKKRSGTVNGQLNPLNIEELSSGIYFFVVETNNKKVVKKFIKF